MERVVRARILSALAGLAGIALLAFDQLGPAIGLFTIAAAVFFLVTERETPSGLADQAVEAESEALARLTRELRLEGRGILLPGTTPAERSLLFIPARDASVSELPSIRRDATFHREGPGVLGTLLPAPGGGFEKAWRELHGLPEGRGAEEGTAHVREALPSFSLGRNVIVSRTPTTLRVAFEPLELADVCRRTREEDAPWHKQGGCPTCNFVAILFARAVNRPLKILDAGSTDGRTFIDLEVEARSPA